MAFKVSKNTSVIKILLRLIYYFFFFFQILVLAVLVAACNAGEVAVSYSTVSNHVAHDYAAPAIAKVAVPAYHTYAAPAIHSYAAPAIHSYAAPAIHSYAAPAIHSYAAPTIHAAPLISKVAVAPVVHKVAVAPVVHKVAAPVYAKVETDHYAPAHYQFEYSVHDPHTHDVKEQKEVREGDAVHGVYSLIEPDGSKRVVEYTADKHNGFNAVVHREHNAHPVAVKAAPVLVKAAPIAYSAPLYHH